MAGKTESTECRPARTDGKSEAEHFRELHRQWLTNGGFVMRGRSPTADEKRHMDAVQSLGCIVCALDMSIFTPAEIHHIAGKTSPGAHFNIIPLCMAHHRLGNDNGLYTSRHPFKKRFEKRYGSEEYLKEQTDRLLEERYGRHHADAR